METENRRMKTTQTGLSEETAAMKQVKKTTLLLVTLTLPLVYGRAGETNSWPNVEEFGEKEGASIQAGFVFRDGRYVDLPYRVSRRGLAVFINDVMVREPIKWPPRNVTVELDPGVPNALDEGSSLDDIENKKDPYEAAWHRKYRFVMQHFAQDQALEEMTKWFESLPFVESVSRKPGSSIIRVRTKDGQERNYGVFRPPEPGFGILRSPNREDVLAEAEGRRREMEKKLLAGNCFFSFSRGGELLFSAPKAVHVLPEAVAVLASEKSKEEKLFELQQLNILPPQYPEGWETMATGFRASPQLEQRIQALRAERATGTDEKRWSDEEEQAIRNQTKTQSEREDTRGIEQASGSRIEQGAGTETNQQEHVESGSVVHSPVEEPDTDGQDDR